MNVSVLLSAHNNEAVVEDTIDSICYCLTTDVLVLVDGNNADLVHKINRPVLKMIGLRHGFPVASYRNYALGLSTLASKFPHSDWYCCCEYDVLFCSDKIKEDLRIAEINNVWCLGNDARIVHYDLPLLNSISRKTIKDGRYLLGCCVFYKGDFIRTLIKEQFFDRFFSLTNDLDWKFPGYQEKGGYDINEYLYPTLANHMGGKIWGMAKWDERQSSWLGNYRKYTMRWRPELTPTDYSSEVRILHPVKNYNNPLREYHRKKRMKNGI